MKNGYAFWGSFFVTIGIILLLNSFNVSMPFLEHSLKLWPLIIVFWGISFLKLNKVLRAVLSALNGLLIALLLASMFANVFGWIRFKHEEFNFVSGRNSTERYLTFEEDIKDTSRIANLVIDGGAATIKIGDTSAKLVEVYTDSPDTDFNFTNDTTEHVYKLNMVDFHLNNLFGSHRTGRNAHIKLNPNKIWDITVNIGASKLNADLSEYIISNLEVSGGAASIDLKLGSKADTSQVSIDVGATSVKLRIPAGAGWQLKTDTGLSNIDFDGVKQSDGNYLSRNYYNSNKKLMINISGGVSSFKIIYY